MSDSVPSFDARALLAEMAWTQRLARRLAGAGGDDVAQDVIAAALQHRPQRGNGLRAWLTAVTRRLAVRHHRDRARRREIESAAVRADAAPSTADTVARLELHRRLAEAVLALAEPYRSVVVARFFDDLTTAEIARQRGVSDAAVRQQLHRGIASLRARLRGEGEEGDRRAWAVVLPRTVRTTLTILTMKKLLIGVAALAVAFVVWERPWLHAPDAVVATTGGDAAALASAPVATPDAAAPVESSAMRTAVAAPPVDVTVLGVRVIAPDATPVRDARVWLWHGDTVESARTDQEGSAHFTPGDGEGRVLVVASDRPATVRDVAPLHGVHEIALPDGAVVGGVVRVDGAVPARPIELWLYDVAAPSSELPADLRAQLETDNVRLDLLAARTAADGSFAFAGLPADWSGRLGVRPMKPYGILRNRGLDCSTDLWTAMLPAPRDDLVLELTKLPAVMGVVRWADDGTPVSSAIVWFGATLVGGETTTHTCVSVDDAGRFEIAIVPQHERESWLVPEHRVGVQELELEVSANGALARKQTLRGAEIDPSGDLGVLLLERASSREMVVVDARGAPVAGAVVEGIACSAPTDAEGRGRVTVRPEQSSYRVAAPGCQVERQTPSGTGTPEDPLRFTVHAGNALVVTVVAEGFAPADLRLELECAQPAFTGSEGRLELPSSLHRVAGSAESRVATLDGDTGTILVRFGLDEHQRVVLCSLVPELPLTLRITDTLGQVAVEQQLRAPALGIRQSIDLRADRPLCTVTGTVEDATGPVARAEVSLGIEHGSMGVRTDRSGRFACTVFGTGAAATLSVADARGARTETTLQLIPDLAPIDIRLREPARR